MSHTRKSSSLLNNPTSRISQTKNIIALWEQLKVLQAELRQMKTSKAPMPYNQDRVCLIYVSMAVKGQGIHMANIVHPKA